MPTQPYRNLAGERRKGVTTVIGGNLGWNKEHLIRWANREGLAGRDVRAADNKTDRAATIGDYTHDAIERSILQDAPAIVLDSTPPDLIDAVAHGVASYNRWFTQSPGTIVATELFGVDEEYQTGWCLDALRLEADGLSLVDWKTSSGTYADHFIQVAAYTYFVEKRLTEWLGPVRLVGAHVVRFDKASGMFSHKFWPRAILDVGWNAFTWCRALDEVRWTIERYTR